MNLPNFDLKDKVALVTGASRGIGLAIAKAYAAAGAKVALSSRKQEALDQAAEEIRAAGGQALPIAAHSGDPEAVKRLAAQVCEAYGGIDILVNNAATNPHFGPLLSAEESHWDKILDVNLKGYARTIKACVESMRLRGGGKIINVASINGLEAQSGMGVYCVSKAGVLMLTRVLAIELAPENIQVNAIAPGLVQTQFSRLLWDTPQIYDTAVQRIPQRRIGQPDELAGIALYLASPASNFTSGAVFVIDGGQLAGSNI
ncbi:MAG: glucose 1-dehydrogenase [Anaerolineales bacterium]|nr:glucose 1-dehydrogenase [Anaerolineales bacterium]